MRMDTKTMTCKKFQLARQNHITNRNKAISETRNLQRSILFSIYEKMNRPPYTMEFLNNGVETMKTQMINSKRFPRLIKYTAPQKKSKKDPRLIFSIEDRFFLGITS